ncbi:MAG: right-handed parallel beta-helix repeat-containing protein [Methanomicrobia archaeon]|nr:right-handed parallel beta-helix repeat-containing protein [Methanomicrobia archaeon]
MKGTTASLIILVLFSLAYPANAATIDLIRSTVEYTDSVDQGGILDFVWNTSGLSNEEVRYLINDIPSAFNVSEANVQISSNIGTFEKIIRSYKVTLRSTTALTGELQVKINISLPSNCPENTYTLNLSEMVGSESDILNPSSIHITVQKPTNNQPTVTVLYPNGGESIPVGTQVPVSAHAIDDIAVTSVTFYYYSSNGGSGWNLIGAGTRVSGTANDGTWQRTWNTNSLSAGSNYLIKAVASDGTLTTEDQSNSTFSLTCLLPVTPPVLNDPGTTDTDGNYLVSWSSVGGATYYTLEEATNSGFSSPSVVYTGSSTSKQITGKGNGTYYYRVKACNACGCSGWSNIEAIVVEIFELTIIYVPSDYPTIQAAVDNAGSGYTIMVSPLTYNENVVITRSLKLIGADTSATIIDGGGSGTCVHIAADNVELSGFTITNADYGVYVGESGGVLATALPSPGSPSGCLIDTNIISNNDDGIYLSSADSNIISNNVVINNGGQLFSGIHLFSSHNNTIINNSITSNDDGIYLYVSNNNVITDNNIVGNDYGIYIYGQLPSLLSAIIIGSYDNLIYHNNFIDNLNHARDNSGTNLWDNRLTVGGDTNSWDNGPTEGGNYWSGHSCSGNPSDGSQPYSIASSGVDQYPFQDKNGWLKESKPPVAIFTYVPLNPVVNQTIIFDCSASYDPDGCLVEYQLDFGDGSILKESFPILMHKYSLPGNYTVILKVTDDEGNSNSTFSRVVQVVSEPSQLDDFDTGYGTYPSISGMFSGTITSSCNLTVSALYTYPCPGTGGHTEYVHIYGNGVDRSASWTGYGSDWRNISFGEPFVLEARKTYYYEIRTGSYPQIHHTDALPTANGWINCTEFQDANGKRQYNWIPAIRFE